MRLAQRQRIEGGRTSGPTRAMTTSDQDIDRIPSNGVDGGWNPWERQALNAQVRLASGQTLRSPAYTSMSPLAASVVLRRIAARHCPSRQFRTYLIFSSLVKHLRKTVNKKSPSTRIGLVGGLHWPGPARTPLSVQASDQGVAAVFQRLLEASGGQREAILHMSCLLLRHAVNHPSKRVPAWRRWPGCICFVITKPSMWRTTYRQNAHCARAPNMKNALRAPLTPDGRGPSNETCTSTGITFAVSTLPPCSTAALYADPDRIDDDSSTAPHREPCQQDNRRAMWTAGIQEGRILFTIVKAPWVCFNRFE